MPSCFSFDASRPVSRPIRLVLAAFCVFFVGVSPSFAQPAQRANDEGSLPILSRKDRPSIEDVLRVRDSLKGNPAIESAELDPRVSQILEHAPRIIAQLESAFPGAIWAPLGRDSAFLADVLEAYYASIGQPNRVVRLNASGTSFHPTEDLRLEFLKSNGLELDSSGRPTRPFVLVDATSWSGTLNSARSQIRRLVGALYEQAPTNSRRDLVTLLNAMGQGGNSSGVRNGPQLSDGVDPGTFLSEIEIGDAGPNEILYTPGTFSYGTLEWHGSFGQFQRQADGRIIAPPGETNEKHLLDRARIVRSMIETSEIVSSSQFQTAVQAEVTRLGYDLRWQIRNAGLITRTEFEVWTSTQRWTPDAVLSFIESSSKGMPPGFRPVWTQRLLHLLDSEHVKQFWNEARIDKLIADLLEQRKLESATIVSSFESTGPRIRSLLSHLSNSSTPAARRAAQQLIVHLYDRLPSVLEDPGIRNFVDSRLYRDLAHRARSQEEIWAFFTKALDQAENLDAFLYAARIDRRKLTTDQNEAYDRAVLERLTKWRRDFPTERYDELHDLIHHDSNQKELQRLFADEFKQPELFARWVSRGEFKIYDDLLFDRINGERNRFSSLQLRRIMDRLANPDSNRKFKQIQALLPAALNRAENLDEFIEVARLDRNRTGEFDSAIDEMIAMAFRTRWRRLALERTESLLDLIKSTAMKAKLQAKIFIEVERPDEFASWMKTSRFRIYDRGLADRIVRESHLFTPLELATFALRTESWKSGHALQVFEAALNRASGLDELFQVSRRVQPDLRKFGIDYEIQTKVDSATLRVVDVRGWLPLSPDRFDELDGLMHTTKGGAELQSRVSQRIANPEDLVHWVVNGKFVVTDTGLVRRIVEERNRFTASQLRKVAARAEGNWEWKKSLPIYRAALERAQTFAEFLDVAQYDKAKTVLADEESGKQETLLNHLRKWLPSVSEREFQEAKRLFSSPRVIATLDAEWAARQQPAEGLVSHDQSLLGRTLNWLNRGNWLTIHRPREARSCGQVFAPAR